MTKPNYPVEQLNDEWEDDGTMPQNVQELSDAVVGHKIVSAGFEKSDRGWWRSERVFVLTLDNGTRVQLADTDDCCAYTALEQFLVHADKIDHVITGVGTTDSYTKWHIFADFGDVMELKVGWSCGNPFYYGYGFDISVKALDE